MAPQVRHGPSDVRVALEAARIPLTLRRYSERDVIYLQGDAGDSVMHVEQGRVWLSVVSEQGKEAIPSLVKAGEFLGVEMIAGQVCRRHTATALTTAEVVVVQKAHMVQLLHAQPSIADRFISAVVARSILLQDTLTDQLLSPGERRLARALVVLADCRPDRPCRCQLPHVSQTFMAEMVGTTRSHVNVFLRRFKARGFVEEDHGRLQVTPILLNALSDVHKGTDRPPHRV